MNLDQYKEDFRRKVLAAQSVLSSENGQILLEMLENELNPTVLQGETEQETFINVGKRDAWMFILEIINKDTGDELA